MADRQYFSNEAERNKALAAAGSGYTYGSTTGANSQTFFIEKKPQPSGGGTGATIPAAVSSGTNVPASTGISGTSSTSSTVQTGSDYIKEIKREPGKVTIQYGNSSILKPELRNQQVTYFDAGSGKGEYRIVGPTEGKTYYDEKNQLLIENGQIKSGVIQQQAQQPAPTQPYTYEVAITGEPAKVQDVEKWGRSQGFKVLRTSTPEEVQKGQYKLEIVSDKPLVGDLGEWLPGVLPLTTRTDEQVKKERIQAQASSGTESAMKNATRLEQAGFFLRTLASPSGYELVGSLVKGTSPTIEAAFPGIRSTNEIIKDVHTELATKYYKGTGTVMQDVITDYLQSPVFDVSTMIVGGIVLKTVSAGVTGAKILGSTAGKAVLGAATAGFVGQRGLEIESLRESGQGGKALGVLATTAVGFAAGIAAYKVTTPTARIRNIQVKFDTQELAGKSDTVARGKEVFSQGKFEITEGKLTGMKGTTILEVNPQKGRGFLITKIPEQTIGKTKIQAQEFTRYVQDLPPLENTPAGRVYNRLSNELKISINEQFAKIAGPSKGQTLLKETGRVAKDTSQGDKILIRTFKGVSEESQAGKYGIGMVTRGGKNILVEESIISSKTFSKVNWVDVLKIDTTKPVALKMPGTATGPGTGTTTASRSGVSLAGKVIPAIPSAPVEVKIIPVTDLVRIVPNVNPVPTGVMIKSSPKLDTELKIAQINTPQIVRQDQGQKPQGRTVSPASGLALAISPQIQKYFDQTKQKIRPVEISVTNPITGQRTSQQSVQEIMQVLEPIVDRIASQPVPVVPISNIRLPPPAEIPWLAPAFFGLGGSKLKRYRTGHVTNPVPEIESLMGTVKGLKIEKVV